MRTLIRLFFKTLRLLLGPFMLLWEWVRRPQGIVREPSVQRQVDERCQRLALYEFTTCPYCIKVRHEMYRLSLPIARRDAQPLGAIRDELTQGVGKVKVPCLKITDDAGHVQWLLESEAIMAYLREHVASN